MKVLVIGAGMQGQVITWNLGRCRAVTEIVLADCDDDRARAVAHRVGGDKARAIHLDASDIREVSKAARGARLVVNAVVAEYNVAIMKACLESGAHYQDMGSGQTSASTIDETFAAQRAFDGDFRSAGLCALTNTGLDPGLSNTLAANAYEDLDRCLEIHIKDFSLFGSPVPIQTWSPETYYADCAQPPLLYEDGEYKRVEPFGRPEYYDFPEPIGRQLVVCHEHDEVSTLPRMLPESHGVKGLTYVDFKMGMPKDDLERDRTLVESGMASKEPVVLKSGAAVRPLDILVATLPLNPSSDEIAELALEGKIEETGSMTVDCVGEKEGRWASYSFSVSAPNIRWINERIRGATGVSYGTSTPASVYAELLLQGAIRSRGVLAPEALDRGVRDEFVRECVRRGLSVRGRYCMGLADST